MKIMASLHCVYKRAGSAQLNHSCILGILTDLADEATIISNANLSRR